MSTLILHQKVQPIRTWIVPEIFVILYISAVCCLNFLTEKMSEKYKFGPDFRRFSHLFRRVIETSKSKHKCPKQHPKFESSSHSNFKTQVLPWIQAEQLSWLRVNLESRLVEQNILLLFGLRQNTKLAYLASQILLFLIPGCGKTRARMEWPAFSAFSGAQNQHWLI